ncbi:MAG: 2-isopropylmalate synthase [Candidatus Atribacteria bacterium]|nr:2-isopropylmalate synthase [Candidatus Atribacteria bacterium]
MNQKIFIFDTTLRDGEQCPGASLNTNEKLEIARYLEKMKVDIIEAGFPISSPGDFEGVETVAKNIKDSTIAALCRAVEQDIKCAWDAIKMATKPRIHTFIATSPIHMEYKLEKKPQEVLEQAIYAVKLAKSYCPEVEFSAEDASRSNPEFLYKIFENVIDAGATIINVPDTVGYAQPDEFGKLIQGIQENVPNIKKAMVSVHCHNDLGLAVANSLESLKYGVQQIECTMNGIGERAGNASLEEIVMALHTRKDFYQKLTDIDTQYIYPTSKLVSRLTGFVIQPNKAIVGRNAFAHEAGIHQAGVLKSASTYEIMKPQTIGLQSNQLVLGKHSGRNAFKSRLSELGYQLDEDRLNKSFQQFKQLADKKKEVYVEDLEALMSEVLIEDMADIYELKYFHVTTGNNIAPTATVKLIKEENTLEDAACGDGPVDALFNAIDRITGVKAKLSDYYIRALTRGKDAQGEAVVEIKDDGMSFVGKSVSTDTLEASVKAYLKAINKMMIRRVKNA